MDTGKALQRRLSARHPGTRIAGGGGWESQWAEGTAHERRSYGASSAARKPMDLGRRGLRQWTGRRDSPGWARRP
jgi:hypothetical protein